MEDSTAQFSAYHFDELPTAKKDARYLILKTLSRQIRNNSSINNCNFIQFLYFTEHTAW